MGTNKLKIEFVSVGALRPSEYNPKKISKEAFAQLKESIGTSNDISTRGSLYRSLKCGSAMSRVSFFCISASDIVRKASSIIKKTFSELLGLRDMPRMALRNRNFRSVESIRANSITYK